MKPISIVILALLIWFSVACEKADDSPAAVTILVPQAIGSLPFTLLGDQGTLGSKEIRITYFTQHAPALVALIREDADFLFTGSTQGWQSYQGGSPLIAVGSYVWGISSLVVSPDGPAAIRDLKHKTISLPFPDSPLDVKTRFLLNRAGLDASKDLVIEYRPFAQAVPLFLSRRIDAVALPEPLASNLVLSEKARRLFDYRTAWGKALNNDGLSPEVTLFTTREKARVFEAFIPLLHQEIGRLQALVTENPPMYAERYASLFGFTPEVIAEAIRQTSFWTCDFDEHRQRTVDYFHEIKGFFSQPQQELPDSFFFPLHEQENRARQ